MSLLPEVESALIDAIRRDTEGRAGAVAGVRRWWRGRPRGLLLAAGVLALAGSAAAAVSLSGERSEPLAGVVSPYRHGTWFGPSARTRYRVGAIEPVITAGSVGWCYSFFTDTKLAGHVPPGMRHGGGGSGVIGCGPAPATRTPIFAQGGGPGLDFVLTAPNVAAVRIDDRVTILTRADPGLPFGLRAAVFQLPSALAYSPRAHWVVAFDTSGRRIAAAQDRVPLAGSMPPANTAPQQRTVSWSGPTRQTQGSCWIDASRRPALRELGGSAALAPITRDRELLGRAFVSCVEIAYDVHGVLLQAALLLDAQDPGSVPAQLPGLRAVPGRPGYFDSPNPTGEPGGPDLPNTFSSTRMERADMFMPVDGLSARRVGSAWLVVAGGTGTRQRLAILHRLRASRNAPR